MYFSSAARRILSNSKSGVSIAALSDALELSGDVAGRRDLSNDLGAWARAGLVFRRRDGRWLWVESNNPLSRNTHSTDPETQPDTSPRGDHAKRLFAVPGRSTVQYDEPDTVGSRESLTGSDVVEPDIRLLLAYYAAGLRTDTRGSVYQLPERHGQAWQLLELIGSWWPEQGQSATLQILLESLPAEFRQALDRRGDDGSIAIGWPLSIGRKQGLEVVQPVGLLAGEFTRSGDSLIITLGRAD